MGFFERFRRKKKEALPDAVWEKGLAKTRRRFWEKIRGLLRTRPKIDDEFLEELEEVLITADVGVDTVEYIVERLKKNVRNVGSLTEEGLYAELYRIMEEMLSPDVSHFWDENRTLYRPLAIMVVGVNGVGKTTTIGKLAYRWRRSGKQVILGAADTFRAAAIDQLKVWTQQAGASLVAHRPGADPGAVVFDTLQAAVARKMDVAIVDTAGRLHTKEPLMRELRKIRKVAGRVLEGAPHETWLVVDATTGQNALEQARRFSEATPLTGIIVTKLDGTAKGGVVLGIAREMKLPIRYVGLGEGIEDLRPFDPHLFVNAFFDEKMMASS